MNFKKLVVTSTVSLAFGGVGSALLIYAPPASAAAPQAVIDSVEAAKDTVAELDGLAIACLTVALTPLGAMLTLRFLNMVLSRV